MGQSRFSVPSSDERFCERLFKFTLTLTIFFSWLNIDNQDKKNNNKKEMFGKMHETGTQWSKTQSNQSELVLTLRHNVNDSLTNEESYLKRL